MKLKFQVNKYQTQFQFEAGLNGKFLDGWVLHSWTMDSNVDGYVVAVFVHDPRIGKTGD